MVITKIGLTAVSANGMSQDAKGEIKLVVSTGSFTCEHMLIVKICDLIVDCLLGADFLKEHEAIIDRRSGKLSLGAHVVPIQTGQQPP